MRTLGKYQVIEKIGVGGFGEVWKGYDPLIKRHVAIKTCETEDEEMRGRFFREAEIAGNLHHRNVTTIYDFGVEGELPYLIQEYLSGEDLDAKIKRRDFLPYPEKLYYLLQVARGLAHAHAQGVIHRDIKPANVRILEDGTAKIMDFGIARLAQQESGLTQTGMTVGTAAYLAPEQIRGETIVRATDVFSFGVMAYELLTFERPFRGDQISAVLYNTLHEEPTPIPELWPEAPPPLTELIGRCLEKPPEKRPADGAALVRALEDVRQERKPVTAADAGDSTGARLPPRRPTPASLDESGFGLGPAVAPTATATATASVDALDGSGVSFSGHRGDRTDRAGLGDLELTSYAPPPELAPPEPRERERPASGTLATDAGSKRWLLAAALLAVAVIAAGAGWWFGRDPAPAVADAAPVVDETIDVGDGASTTTAAGVDEDAEPSAGQQAESGLADGEPANGAGGTEADAAPPPIAAAPAAAVQAAPPPPPPPRGIGLLTVRAGLGKPQGTVRVDGEILGQTPIRGRRLPAGEHRLEILPLGEEAAAIDQAVRIEPGQEAVVTFDLGRGTARVSQKSR